MQRVRNCSFSGGRLSGCSGSGGGSCSSGGGCGSS